MDEEFDSEGCFFIAKGYRLFLMELLEKVGIVGICRHPCSLSRCVAPLLDITPLL